MNLSMPVKQMIDVLFVIVPHSLLLDVAGPSEAFRLANLHLEIAGMLPRFRLRFAGPPLSAPKMPTSVGLLLTGLESFPAQLTAPTWVVVVGQPNAYVREASPEIMATARWLHQSLREPLSAAISPHRLVTICSGALLAARAGLLAKRQCTTHHEMLELLRALAPEARVVDNRVFLVDGPLASSAGVTAGIDLALHLIAEECGEALASSVAQDMVVYLRRSSRDSELSPFLAHRNHVNPAIHRVQNAINAALDRNWDMPALAEAAHVSERHLLRLFIEHVGVSPMQYVETIQLERARQSLERGASVAHAAEFAGFGSSQQLRRAWKRNWGGSPRDGFRAAIAQGNKAVR